MLQRVSALFRTRSMANAAVVRLMKAGFARSDISLLRADVSDSTRPPPPTAPRAVTPLAAGFGAMLGAVLGGVLAVLVAARPSPQMVSLAVAGPVVAALVGVGCGGTLGAALGALLAIALRRRPKLIVDGAEGNVLLGIDVPNERAADAVHLLDDAGGRGIVID